MSRQCARCGSATRLDSPERLQDRRAVYCPDCGHIAEHDRQQSLSHFAQGGGV